MASTYSTGTISVTAGATTFTGSGTAWALYGITGGVVFVDGGEGGWLIDAITGDGEGTFALPWPGPNLTGVAYSIWLETASAANAATANRNLAEIVVRLRAGTFLQPDATGTLGERDQYDSEPQGFVYLESNVDPFLVSIKVTDATADWSTRQPLRGDTGPGGALLWIDGGWSSGVNYAVNNGLAHNGASYRCHTAHTSGTPTEPGVGADWASVWEVAAAKGDTGDKGWTAQPALEIDDDRVVMKVHAFTGGEGPPPSGAGQYIGAAGLTSDIGAAIDVRGFTGLTGPRGVVYRSDWNAGASYFVSDLVRDDDALGDPAIWIAVAASIGSRPRDNPTDWDLFPGSFPDTVNDGVWGEAVDETINDGVWGA